jgi:crotonobetainyl-CoA:carnitine CoA-transferase CaiB-like acyl-CoA transferase
MWHRFGFMDHQCALSSVVATLLALRRRDETGEGQVVNASLLGAGVLTTGEAVRLADGTLTPVARVDADQTGITPGRRIVACADGWVALSTDRTDLGGVIPSVTEDLQALAVERGITSEALMGALTNALESAYQQLPEAIADARVVLDPDSGDFQVFAQERDVTPPDFGRIAAQTAKQVMTTRLRVADGEQKVEGTDGVAGWKTAELLARLEEAGIPAELVREQQRDPFFDSEANRAAGLVASYEHGQWGQLEQPGALWWFGDLDVHLHRAPPLLGEHTAGVLAEAGLDADAVRALVTAGAAVAADLD